MAENLENQYEVATSQNLPRVDLEMWLDYILNNENFNSAEIRGVKTARSARGNYGDAAIEYVQLRRVGSMCTVKSRICPEHRVRNKPYNVTVIINEENGEIEKAECHDCIASSGGCKHGIALVGWLHRRSEEPSPTSVTCYWKKSTLSKIGTTLKAITLKDITGTNSANDQLTANVASDDTFLATIIEKGLSNVNSQLVCHFTPPTAIYCLSLHHIALRYPGSRSNAELFMQNCSLEMRRDNIKEAEVLTRQQSSSPLWHELRYGRITASRLYEAAHCGTSEGLFVEKIMGSKFKDTLAMQRGIQMEKDVLAEFQKKCGIHIKNCGLILDNNYPVFGASPDGVTDTHVIELKCPQKAKTFAHYYSGGSIKPKYLTQIQMQMLLAGKQKGLFCIAYPTFEESSDVEIIEVELNIEYLLPIIEEASRFWKKAIFPILIRS